MNVHVIHYRAMNLSSYLEQRALSDASFASEIGVSRSMVTKLRNGQAKPSAETALKIQSVTKGEVMLSDLLDNYGGDRSHDHDGADA